MIPQLLADIRRQCREHAAELDAVGALEQPPAAPERPQSGFAVAEVSPPISEADRFAAAVLDLPPDVRRFFEHEDPAPPHRWESDQERAERDHRTNLGCWCG